MSDAPRCPTCSEPIDGLHQPARRKRQKAFHDGSTGYCMKCHLPLTKIDGEWARSPARGS